MYATPHIAGPTDGIPMPRRLGAILAVAFGVSLSVIDGSIANVALPTIGAQLGISAADSIWVVNAYQLAIMVSLLSFSALGDVIGYRKVYIGGLMLFTVASVGCSLAGSFQSLVLARVMQGFGAAAITSVNTTLIRFIYPKTRLGRGMGINATVVAVSSVAGPTIAAGILAIADWPWLFAVNIPIGLAALSLSHRFLPQNPIRDAAHRFSWRDAVMNALTFGLLMASVEGFSHGINPTLLSFGIAALLVIGFFFIRSQLRETYPILPFDLLRIPIFSVSILTSICSFVAQMLALVALPFYLQHVCGYSDVQTGLILTAWPAVIIVVAPVAGMLVERAHAGLLGGIGLTAMATGLFLLAWIPENCSAFGLIWRLVLCGAGFGLFQSPNNSVLIASAPPSRSGSASGMLATARLVGQTTGAALMALLFHLLPQNSTHAALMTAGGFALAAAAVSFARISLPPLGTAAQNNTTRFIRPPYLHHGDTVGIVSPAGKLPQKIDTAKIRARFESWGLHPKFGQFWDCRKEPYFAATDRQRAEDLQRMIDDPSVKAILAGRGGYGSVRLLPLVDFSSLRKNPKWIIGFSDITTLHLVMRRLGIESIHGPMLTGFHFDQQQESSSVESLRKALFGEMSRIHTKPHPLNRHGVARGRLAGGNLTMICAANGTPEALKTDTPTVLLIEEVGEAAYRIDRMMQSLERCGVLRNVRAVLVGHFTRTSDCNGFGVPNAEAIIARYLRDLEIPVVFGFPAGHEEPNFALYMGREVTVRVDQTGASIDFLTAE